MARPLRCKRPAPSLIGFLGPITPSSPPITRRDAAGFARFSGRPASISRRPGAYYIMAGIAAFGATDDVAFARYLVREIGVATVPGSSFFQDKSLGRPYVRFCFCKRDETLDEAAQRLRRLRVIV